MNVDEFGGLDGLDTPAIAALEPKPDEHRLVTRLANGSQVVVGKRKIQDRLQALLDGLDGTRYSAIVLLCTGEFPGLVGPGLFLDAQHIVDHGVAALCHGIDRLGLVLPLAGQIDEFHYTPPEGQQLIAADASPYEGDRLEQAGAELRGCDIVVMHCMGYSEAHRTIVAAASGAPVLLARHLVAAALTQLL